MLTIREAMSRLSTYKMGVRRFGHQWQVFFREDANNDDSIIVDDLEEAVLEAARLRRNRDGVGSIEVPAPWKFPRNWKQVEIINTEIKYA